MNSLLAAAFLSASITVTDDIGKHLELGRPASRIISLTPQATELLYEIGAQTTVVGTARYSNYPAAANELPRIGDAFRLRREKILALAPDLALVWGSGTPRNQRDWLARQGIPVYTIESRRLEDIPRTLRNLGILTGHAQRAHKAAQAFERRVQRLRDDFSTATPRQAVYLLWPKPPMTINRQHIISDALQVCRTENLFANGRQMVATLRSEQLIASNPDVIVSASGEIPAWLPERAKPDWIVVNPDTMHRATSRLLDAIGPLCAQLHPSSTD